MPLTVLPLSTFAQAAPDCYLADAQQEDDFTSANDNLIRIPQNLEDFVGQEVSFSTLDAITTTGHPVADTHSDQVYLLYNTGTKKFLNVGGYYGTHTALSNVPRVFWFQQRNDVEVANQWTYLRYSSQNRPQTQFANNFFSLKHIQIGSTEGKNHSHVTYKSVKVVPLDGNPAKVLYENYAPQGTAFSKELDIDFSKEELQAVIDLTNCQGTHGGSPGLETIFSVGEDISQWKTSITDLHIYAYKNADGTYAIRVQPLDPSYSDQTHKSGGQENPITIGSDHLVNLCITSNDILVNGVSCLPRNFSVREHNPMLNFPTSGTFQVGSYGTVGSHAKYNQLVLEKSDGTDTRNLFEDETTAKEFDGAAWKRDFNAADFYNGYTLKAQITLSDAPQVDEDIFSAGTDITQSGKDGENIHLYYKGKTAEGKHVLQLALYDSYYPTGLKHRVEVDADGNFTLTLSPKGIAINDVYYLSNDARLPQLPTEKKNENGLVRFKQDEYGSFLLDENGKYILASESEKGDAVKVLANGYVPTDERHGQEIGCVPMFITSNTISETNQSGNEGNYMMFAPRYESNHKWGSVGTFIDRNLPAHSKNFPLEKTIECAQWFFEPVQNDKSQNLYHIFLEMTDAELMEGDPQDNVFTSHPGTHRYYLQSSADNVVGNKKEEYDPSFTQSNTSNWTAVEATYSEDGTTSSEDAVWKVISLADYYQLFHTEKSEMSTLLDLSFVIHDQDFTRRNGSLSFWQMDESLTGKVRIGYDGNNKNAPTETDYTADDGSALSAEASATISNHGRYMGVDVRNGGYGQFYQDVKVYQPGWYAISCGGMSNVGARLFVQWVKDDGALSTMMTTPLYALSSEEKAQFEATDQKWPFDEYDTETPMPMYNALVAINDDKVNSGALVNKYNVQLPIYIDPQVLQDEQSGVTLRLGIDIPQENVSTDQQALDQQWTVFDDFHLLFGGKSQEPNLVLDEKRTDLDYLENTLHCYDLRPMHLNRTFTPGVWNTLVLPVSLSYDDFTKLFGTDAKLAHLNELKETYINFRRVETSEDNVFLKAFEPYIILPTVAHGDHEAYTAELANRSDGGKTFTTVSVPDNHFYLESATLGGKHTDEVTMQSYYQFKADYPGYILATEQATGGGHKPLISYGTLCQTYDEVKHTVLEGRPNLKDCYVMYQGAMIRIQNQYGMKGFRCWFGEVDEAGQSANNLPVFIDGVADNTTGIEDIVSVDNTVPGTRFADGVYNLNGQKVGTTADLGQLPAGIYIVNGIKHIIK